MLSLKHLLQATCHLLFKRILIHESHHNCQQALLSYKWIAIRLRHVLLVPLYQCINQHALEAMQEHCKRCHLLLLEIKVEDEWLLGRALKLAHVEAKEPRLAALARSCQEAGGRVSVDVRRINVLERVHESRQRLVISSVLKERPLELAQLDIFLFQVNCSHVGLLDNTLCKCRRKLVSIFDHRYVSVANVLFLQVFFE